MDLSPRIALLSVATAGALILLTAAMATALAASTATQGGWPPSIEVSRSEDSISRVPDLQMLEYDGTLRAFWLEQALLSDTLHYTIYPAKSTDDGSNWSQAVPLTPTNTDRYEPDVDTDEHGWLHAVWRESPDEHQVWYGRLWDTSWEEWGEQDWGVMITATNHITLVFEPNVEVGGEWIHVIWSEQNRSPTATPFEVFYSRSESGWDWSTPEMAAETGKTSLQLHMTADQHDNLHVVWQENTEPPAIWYISGTVDTDDTVWSTPITISEGLSELAATPCIAVDTDDVVHVAFGVDVQDQDDVQDLYYARFPISDTDSISATLIPGSRVDISQLLPTYASPAIALVGTDQVHLAWNGMRDGDYADRVYYTVSQDGGTTWSTPVPATPRDTAPDGFPCLAADGEFVYLLYQEQAAGGDDQDIYFTKRFPLSLRLPLFLKGY
jgi:hypothetical protein